MLDRNGKIRQLAPSEVNMKKTKDVECAYLAQDHRSCTSVEDVEGQAARSEGCSAEFKNLCCYLCEKKETCATSCSLLDESEDKETSKGTQMSPLASPDGAEKVFLCPFCGAPYRKLIPPGAVQVKCDYCGARILVPPHMGGEAQRCPNHLDVLANGICNECGQSFCDKCLYVVRGGQQYLCPNCYKDYKSSQRTAWLGVAIMPVIMIVFGLYFLANPEKTSTPPEELFGFTLIGTLLLLALVAGVRWFSKQNPVSVNDMRRLHATENGQDESGQ